MMTNMSPPVECWDCKQVKSPVGYTNIMNGAAASVPSVFKPVCAECWEKNHDPFARVARELATLRAALAAAQATHATQAATIERLQREYAEVVARLEAQHAELVALRGAATDEAVVEVAATKLRELRLARLRRFKERLEAGLGTECSDDLTGDARAVLAAVGPMIVAAERERCAAIADTFTCGLCGIDGKCAAAIRAGVQTQ
jgi:hypothetical protein